MKRGNRIVLAGVATLLLAGCASSEKTAGGVLVVSEESRVQGCRAVGTVSDDDLGDLQKKAAKLGANTVLLTPQRKAKGGYFGLQDYMTGDAYACTR